MPANAIAFIEFQREWLDPEVGTLNALMQDRELLATAVEGARRALEAGRRNAEIQVIHCPMVLSSGYAELGPASFGLRAAIQKAGTWLGPAGDFAPGCEVSTTSAPT